MEISKIFTLEAGDLILTGTPEGVGPIQATFFFVRGGDYCYILGIFLPIEIVVILHCSNL